MSILFIHGAGANPSVWHLQTVYFKDSFAVELPGHPTGSGLTTIEGYTQVVERQIAQNSVPEPIIVGQSMEVRSQSN